MHSYSANSVDSAESTTSAELATSLNAEATQAHDPHFASGCVLMLEVEVDTAALKQQRGTVWHDGPLIMHRRPTTTQPKARAIPLEEREQRLGPYLAETVYAQGRRFHRRVDHRFHPIMTVVPARGLHVTGFELLLAAPDAFAYEDARLASAARDNSRWTPGIAMIHLALPGAESADRLACSLINDKYRRNTLGTLLQQNERSFCNEIEALINAAKSSVTLCRRTTDGVFAPDGNFDCIPPRPNPSTFSIRAVGADTNSMHGSVGSYLVLTDIAARDEHPSTRFPEITNGEVRSETRQRIRQALSRQLIGLNNGAKPLEDYADPQDCAVSWNDWHATFTTRSAGFAYVHEHGYFNPYRREELSGILADILALELLKIRLLTVFADHAHELARSPGGAAKNAKTLQIWRDYVRFTTEYIGRNYGLDYSREEFRLGFQRGLGRDLTVDVAHTDNNLNRLAEIARLEQAEERRLAEQRDEQARLAREAQLRNEEVAEEKARAVQEERERKIAKQEEAARNRVHVMLGIFATIFLPLSAVPPILEWYYQTPNAATALVRWLWVGTGVAVVGVVLLIFWAVEKRRGRTASVAEASAAQRPLVITET